MNKNKIAFIYCVNDEELFEESVRYVRALNIPEYMEIEIIPIRGATSICSGYNKGMKQSDAKYKVYLHQDVFIINHFFIKNLIEIFEDDARMGMLGVIGAKTLPQSGIWWDSKNKYGQVIESSYTGGMNSLDFIHPVNKAESVKAIDGLIMITQFDIAWKEEIFNDWHFYDISQCQEFIANGYEVGVVKQEQTWCVHDSKKVELDGNYEKERKKFINKYKDVLFAEKDSNDAYEDKSDNYYQMVNHNILKHVNPQADLILDVGCAQGNLGYVIKQKFGSRVFGIEAFQSAALEAEKKLDRVFTGDIEDLELPFDKDTFDHIIYGDVLEHLINPGWVLKKMNAYLNDQGTVIASIPNIAHSTVLLSLLQGNWTYEEAGLLDKTHLRFFTKNEIKKMFEESGYEIILMEDVIFTNENYDKLNQYLYEVLKNINIVNEDFLERLRAYQYIVIAKKKQGI